MMCLDSCIIEASVNGEISYYYVRGYEHPITGYIVEPYMRDRCRKIRGRVSLCENPICRYIPYFGRRIPILEKKLIVSTVNPSSSYSQNKNRLPRSIRELLDILESYGLGLTGSWALGCERKESDVDLVVINYDEELFKMLESYKRKGKIRQCRFQEIISRRRKNDISTNNNKINNSLLDSCFNTIPYTLRVLRSSSITTIIEWRQRYIDYGEIMLQAIIKDPGIEAYLTPARYILANARIIESSEDLPDNWHTEPIILETWRTRYAELTQGRYLIRGRLHYDIWRSQWIITPDWEGGIWCMHIEKI